MIAAAKAAGVGRVIAQGFGGWRCSSDPPKNLRRTVKAMRYIEAIAGVVLRYGVFYGPGTSIASNGSYVRRIRQRRFPIIGEGTAQWSFIRVEDAARATVVAIDRVQRGAYDVLDDEPVTVSEWVPYLADLIGAKPPRRLPRWVGRLVGGEVAVAVMNDVRGGSNAATKRALDWQPRFASGREGFRETFRG